MGPYKNVLCCVTSKHNRLRDLIRNSWDESERHRRRKRATQYQNMLLMLALGRGSDLSMARIPVRRDLSPGQQKGKF